ncbi:MAG: hypothetical protein Q7R49_06265 [Candidatus Daviesbacteria bacterium]|nr:hypothetical protein [Candidatus Daviesbacteria bacterium]
MKTNLSSMLKIIIFVVFSLSFLTIDSSVKGYWGGQQDQKKTLTSTPVEATFPIRVECNINAGGTKARGIKNAEVDLYHKTNDIFSFFGTYNKLNDRHVITDDNGYATMKLEINDKTSKGLYYFGSIGGTDNGVPLSENEVVYADAMDIYEVNFFSTHSPIAVTFAKSPGELYVIKSDSRLCPSRVSGIVTPSPALTPTSSAPTPTPIPVIGAPSVKTYEPNPVTVGEKVTVKGNNLNRIKDVRMWYSIIDPIGAANGGERMIIDEGQRTNEQLVFTLSDPRKALFIDSDPDEKTIMLVDTGGYVQTSPTFKIKIKKPIKGNYLTPSPSLTLPPVTGGPQATRTVPVVFGYEDPTALDQKDLEAVVGGTGKISVGSRTSIKKINNEGEEEEVCLSFTGALDSQGRVMSDEDVISLTLTKTANAAGVGETTDVPISFKSVTDTNLTGRETGALYTCTSYWATLPVPMAGTYKLTATYTPTGNRIGKYQGSTGFTDFKITDEGKIPTSSRTPVTGPGQVIVVMKGNLNSKSHQILALSKILSTKSSASVAGVAVTSNGDTTTVVNDPNVTSNDIVITPSVMVGQSCDANKIPVVTAVINKIKNDGSVESILNDANYPNCQPFTVTVDLASDNRIEATTTYPADPTSQYEPAQSSATILVGSTEVQAKTYVKLSSNPDTQTISALDNPVIIATTNKAVENPEFEVKNDGQTVKMAPTSSSIDCQNGTGVCQYVLNLFQPSGSYEITFRNGNDSDTIKFNTAGDQTTVGNSCPYSGDTCSYSTADGLCYSGHGATGFNTGGCEYSCGPITCPGNEETPASSDNISGVGIIDNNGTERALSLSGGFIDLDLGDGDQTVYRLVIHYNDGTADSFRTLIFNSPQSAGGTNPVVCDCTYGSVCDVNGKPGTQTCNGVTTNGACQWDGTGACSADCTACVPDQTNEEPIPTPVVSDSAVESVYWDCLDGQVMQHNPGTPSSARVPLVEADGNAQACQNGCSIIQTAGYISDAACN